MNKDQKFIMAWIKRNPEKRISPSSVVMEDSIFYEELSNLIRMGYLRPIIIPGEYDSVD